MVQALDHGGRRARRGGQAEPRLHVEARIARLRQRGHIGQQRRAPGAGDGDRAQLACLHMGQGRGRVVEHGIHLPAQQVGDGRCAAPVGHVQHAQARELPEHLARQVDRRAAARRGEADALRTLPGMAHIVGHVLYGQARVDHEDVGNLGDQADGLEVLDRVIAEPGVERGIDGVGNGVDIQRVAVRRRPRHGLGAHIAVGARAVVHHHALAQLLAHPGGHQACDHVGGATGRIAHHEPHGPGRPGRRLRQHGCGRQRHGRDGRGGHAGQCAGEGTGQQAPARPRIETGRGCHVLSPGDRSDVR